MLLAALAKGLDITLLLVVRMEKSLIYLVGTRRLTVFKTER
jgi:hypothetical protein